MDDDTAPRAGTEAAGPPASGGETGCHSFWPLVVVTLSPTDTRLLHEWAREHGIPAGDLEAFAERALSRLVNLHEGNASRYGIRPSELSAWLERHRA